MQTQITLKLGTAKRVIPAPAKLTQASVKAALRAIGVTFKKTDWNEYRINIAGGTEETAAYESDLESALDTGRAIAAYAEKTRFKAANDQPRKVYRLGSSDMCHAPGVIAWAQNGYYFESDRAAILPIVRDTWNVPDDVAHRICMGEGRAIDDVYVLEV